MWKGIIGRPFTAQDFDGYAQGLNLSAWWPQFVVVHNTGAPTLAQWHGPTPAAQRIRNLEAYYRDQQRWSSGPHLFVADDFIWAFTPLNTPGTHSPSWNSISWGMEIVGDYDREPFLPAIKHNAVSALASLHRKAGLNPDSIRFHKEDPRTTHRDCPGHNIDKADLIACVKQQLGISP